MDARGADRDCGRAGNVDSSRKAVRLCAAGTEAEFAGRRDDARALYLQAWDGAVDDYERCVAAHYVAHLEPDPAEALRWNTTALAHARLADQRLVADFLGSLYVNLGHSHEVTGNAVQAATYYALAAEHGVVHRP